jgi:transcriptional regulator with XRE-family HTH domain
MNSFVSKPILTSQTIGERFRKARLGSNFSISQISKKLGIKECYLIALELGHYSELPGEIYALEFTKKYALALYMDPQEAANAFLLEQKGTTIGPKHEWSIFATKKRLFDNVRKLAGFAIVMSIITALIYGLSIGQKILGSPDIEIAIPSIYYETSNNRVTIQGQALRADKVLLNGEEIEFSKDGSFSELLSLGLGQHIVRITVVGRLGKNVTKYRMVVVQEDNNLVLLNE